VQGGCGGSPPPPPAGTAPGQLRNAGNVRWPSGTSRSASSTECTGAKERLSREVLGMVRSFLGKNGGFI
jgi:hypothetical protein